MATIKKTFKDLRLLNTEYTNLLKEIPTIEKTKFGYAWKRFFAKNVQSIFEEYNTLMANSRIDNALANKETGEVMTDMLSFRGFKYDKEGLKKVIAQELALQNEWDPKEYDVEPYICSEIPPNLSDWTKDMFKGVIIAEE